MFHFGWLKWLCKYIIKVETFLKFFGRFAGMYIWMSCITPYHQIVNLMGLIFHWWLAGHNSVSDFISCKINETCTHQKLLQLHAYDICHFNTKGMYIATVGTKKGNVM